MSLQDFDDDDEEDFDDTTETWLYIILDCIYALAVMIIILICIFYFVSDIQQYNMAHSIRAMGFIINKG